MTFAFDSGAFDSSALDAGIAPWAATASATASATVDLRIYTSIAASSQATATATVTLSVAASFAATAAASATPNVFLRTTAAFSATPAAYSSVTALLKIKAQFAATPSATATASFDPSRIAAYAHAYASVVYAYPTTYVVMHALGTGNSTPTANISTGQGLWADPWGWAAPTVSLSTGIKIIAVAGASASCSPYLTTSIIAATAQAFATPNAHLSTGIPLAASAHAATTVVATWPSSIHAAGSTITQFGTPSVDYLIRSRQMVGIVETLFGIPPTVCSMTGTNFTAMTPPWYEYGGGMTVYLKSIPNMVGYSMATFGKPTLMDAAHYSLITQRLSDYRWTS